MTMIGKSTYGRLLREPTLGESSVGIHMEGSPGVAS